MSLIDDLKTELKRIHDALHSGTLDAPTIDDALARAHQHLAAHEGAQNPSGAQTVTFTDTPADIGGAPVDLATPATAEATAD